MKNKKVGKTAYGLKSAESEGDIWIEIYKVDKNMERHTMGRVPAGYICYDQDKRKRTYKLRSKVRIEEDVNQVIEGMETDTNAKEKTKRRR